MRRLFVLLLLSLPAFAQKHPFTFEDMMKLKRVGEPVPSPDGKWVAFSAVDVSLEANTKTPHIWIVPLTEAGPQSGTTANYVGTAAPGRSGEPSSPGSSEREIIPTQDSDRPRCDAARLRRCGHGPRKQSSQDAQESERRKDARKNRANAAGGHTSPLLPGATVGERVARSWGDGCFKKSLALLTGSGSSSFARVCQLEGYLRK